MSALPHKFPRTPHLSGSASTRDDRVLSAADTRRVLAAPLAGEEKLDGANLGIAFDPDTRAFAVQNRGRVLGRGEHAQFAPLWGWLALRREALWEALGTAKILFGEWLYARHSLPYDRLPDWFLAFDLYDRGTRTFACRAALESACSLVDAHPVPVLFRGRVLGSVEALNALVGPSLYGPARAEGIYLRSEQGGVVTARYKWVRRDFTAGITEHWRDRPVEPNGLRARE